MRAYAIVPLLLLSSLAAQAAPAPDGAPYHLVFAHRPATAGEHVELTLEPPVPPGYRVHWSAGILAIGPRAVWRAPYRIAPGASPVMIGAAVSGPGIRSATSEEIVLVPGSVPGSEDCLGPGQSFSTLFGGIEPDFGEVPDELPAVLQRVEPEYPASARARGVTDTIPVNMLVCRTGRVLDAYVPPAVARPGDTEPIARDPVLVEAALAACRQWIFSPARNGGQAYAVWVSAPVRFPPR